MIGAAGRVRRTGDAGMLGRVIAGEAVLALGYAEPGSGDDLARVSTRASRDGAGWVLDGAKAVVSGAPWSTHLLVTARSGGGDGEAAGVSLFLVEKAARGLSTQDIPTVDGRRASRPARLGSLPAGCLLGTRRGSRAARTRDGLGVAALCAEALACSACSQRRSTTPAASPFRPPDRRFPVLQHRWLIFWRSSWRLIP